MHRLTFETTLLNQHGFSWRWGMNVKEFLLQIMVYNNKNGNKTKNNKLIHDLNNL
jgi:hypothetical protein